MKLQPSRLNPSTAVVDLQDIVDLFRSDRYAASTAVDVGAGGPSDHSAVDFFCRESGKVRPDIASNHIQTVLRPSDYPPIVVGIQTGVVGSVPLF